MNLRDLAAVVRSKNAGIHYLTLDIMFEDRAVFEAVRRTGVLSAETIAARYGLDPAEVRVFTYDTGLAFKATLPRDAPAGSRGEADIYGAQQHAPLLDLDVPIAPPIDP